MIYVRSLIFDTIFYILTPIYLIFFWPLIYIKPRTFVQKIFYRWVQAIVWGLKHIVCITHKVEGLEHLEEAKKKGPVIVASRHESVWDTVIFAHHLDPFVIVLKQDLLYIPVFGSYLKKLNSIALDRSQGSKSLKILIRDSAHAHQNGFNILIYPEGTRCAPGESKPIQSGIAFLYNQLNCPILPVSHNAGCVWGRRSPYKKPGIITLQFHPLIKPGLPKQNILNQLSEILPSEHHSKTDREFEK